MDKLNNTNLIAISGRIGSGKDLVGRIIQVLTSHDVTPNCINKLMAGEAIDGNHASPYEIKKFAAKVKEVASILTGIPVADMENEDVKNTELSEEWWLTFYEDSYGKREYFPFGYRSNGGTLKPSLRWLLQNIGTEAMRNNIHPSVWINALFADYKVNDAFENDSKWLITDCRFPNEAKAIRDRGGIIIRLRRNEDGTDTHESETALDGYVFDYIIDNRDGDIPKLIEEVKAILIKEQIIN